ncbi:large ribosomal subunit protein bL35m-like [Choristoneura fumiferana]|uniref:large ribosomal subunit protein bL35m-like n=1 Tax=Choristoneura fumiferana TaxID=7141 RepID=UPI003D15A681
MLRTAITAVRCIRPLALKQCKAARTIVKEVRSFTTLHQQVKSYSSSTLMPNMSLVNNPQILNMSKNITVPVRTVTKFSLKKGKRKTVKAVIRRFFRLHWGIWIRPMVGRSKKLWKKSPPQKRRLRQHVFTNATQTTLLDKMVTKCWKKPKYYVNDPYSPYHTREEFHVTRKHPEAKN